MIVGTNVNMVGAPGYIDPVTGEIINDPTLNRQNEPSHAFSTRNPCHLLAGANDYRLVDLEAPLLGDERADAWVGVFKSFDCGRSWTSVPHPGHQLDLTAAGRAAPIFGRHAAADATVRALPGGRFLYSGLAFDRGGVAQVFVSLFEDRNNEDGGDSIDWLGTVVIDSGQSGQFLDKPWIATTADGTAFIAYTIFLGSGNNVHTQIKVAKYNGSSWSNSQKISESVARNQGTTIAVDPGTGYVYVAWREFTDPRDSIMVSRSTNGGNSFSKAARIEPVGPTGQPYRLSPFDQTASTVTFRTFSYPTIAIVPAVAESRAANAPGRVYIAWAARGFVPLRNQQTPGQTSDQVLGDARIVYSTSTNGTSWTYPKVADGAAEAGHQLMPALASAGGKLALAYYDLRADASLTFDDLVVEYGQAALEACLALAAGDPLVNMLQCLIETPSLVVQRRHTLDVRAAIADGACLADSSCALDSSSVLTGNRQVSRYLQAYTGPSLGAAQLQFNPPNLPLFKKGTIAFIGDYIDIQGLDFVPDGVGGWEANTGATASSPAPFFMVTWADNRNVRRPGTAGWEQFTRINSPACEPGQAGIRNQDVYSALLKPGLTVSAPLNARRIGDLQRSFPIVIANNTSQLRTYQITTTPPAGIVASFDQFAGFSAGSPITTLDLSIPPRSSATRTLFVLKSAGAAQHSLVPLDVTETGPFGATDRLLLNPDLTNPDPADISVDQGESHLPDLGTPTLQVFTNTPGVKTPDFETPDFETPDFETPDFETPDFETNGFQNLNFQNPDFETPDFETPDFETPDFETATVADVSWKVTNTGNVTSAYKANINIPGDRIGTKYQLVVRTVTVQSLTSALGCKAGLLPQNQVLVNVVDPDVHSNLVGQTSVDFNSPDPKNATFTLGKQQSAIVTLRAYCNANVPGANGPGGCTAEGPIPLDASGRPLVAASSVAQAANCRRCVGASCTSSDLVGAATECTLDDGLPKDIYDPIPPVFGTAPAPVISDADDNGNEIVSFTVNVSDNIGITSFSCTDGTVTPGAAGSYTVSSTFPVGTSSVTCEASDASGNVAPLTVEVVVNDVTPPGFAPFGPTPGAPFTPGNPAEAAGPSGAVVQFTNPLANDTHDGAATVTCSSNSGLTSGSTFPIGTTPINCVATDSSGNATPSTPYVNIVVADTTPPSITVPSTITVEATGPSGRVVSYSVSASDLVDPSPTLVCTIPSDSVFALGATTVDCTATDGGGNDATKGFNVVVVDTMAPALTVPAVVNVEATGPAGAAAFFSVSSADSVDLSPTVVCSRNSGSMFALGSTTVMCTATDDSGNATSKSFNVNVGDTTKPVLTGFANITVTTSSASGAAIAYVKPTGLDLVSGSVPVTCTPASGSIFPVGTTTIACSAADAAGNVATGSMTATVILLSATATASPSTLLWSPNKTMTPVTISGTITMPNPTSVTYATVDEYNKVKPSGSVSVAANGNYSFVVSLEAYRNGNDANGRLYTITVTAVNASGQKVTAAVTVRVPHNQ